jgi:molybdate transport system substrate-binding protein
VLVPTPRALLLVFLGFSAPWLATACGKPERSGATVRVAMASDLQPAFEELGPAFREATGIEPVFTPGSTGLLARQLKEGAPFDVFAAAAVSFVDDVVAAGACDGATRQPYAQGRVVLWSAKEAPARLEDLVDPRFATIAIANPEHAPYGRAARQALQRGGVWDQVASRMVYGENVLQAMQYARSGNADVALVALSLATVGEGGSFQPVDPALHDPLDQVLVVCGSGAGAEAGRRFAAFLATPDARAIMKRYGFRLPGE